MDESTRFALETGGYLLALPITFVCGLGTTLAVSRESVRFSTRSRLVMGQRLTGHLRFPMEGDTAGSVLRYAARVTCVRETGNADGAAFEVTALFEQLAFVQSDGA